MDISNLCWIEVYRFSDQLLEALLWKNEQLRIKLPSTAEEWNKVQRDINDLSSIQSSAARGQKSLQGMKGRASSFYIKIISAMLIEAQQAGALNDIPLKVWRWNQEGLPFKRFSSY